MNPLVVVTIVLVSLWMVILSVTVLLLTRQLGLITLRLRFPLDSVEDGVLIGTPVPKDTLSIIPELDRGLHYLICLAPNCGPCVDFASRISELKLARNGFRAVFEGTGREADALAEALPEHLPVLRDPEASVIFKSFDIKMTPSIFQVEDGVVVGKGVLKEVADLERFVGAYPMGNTKELARIAREASRNGN